jgi:hypothetical protein
VSDITATCRAAPLLDLLAAGFIPVLKLPDADVAELMVAWSNTVKVNVEMTSGRDDLHAIAQSRFTLFAHLRL